LFVGVLVLDILLGVERATGVAALAILFGKLRLWGLALFGV
jgi:hypothetical protein